ncbi:MAG: nucleoside triphosphate pyrophosphatase [Myxococcota bacterium]
MLASTSPYRKALLARLGLPFTQAAPDVDEAPAMTSGRTPFAIARELAEAKARAVAAGAPGAHVLGGDQVVDLDGEVLGKPGSEAACIAQLGRLAGRTHRLLTAMALVGPEGSARVEVHETRLTLRALGQDAIARYVAREKPTDCCGSYRIEGQGIALFARIEGEDFTAIEGLALLRLSGWLREAGFRLP